MARSKSFPSRRRARKLAVQALYEAQVAGHSWERSLDRLLEEASVSSETASFARELVPGVDMQQPTLDQLITRLAPLWPVEQLAVIDATILRLALFELLFYPTTPPKVVINEAVELAKLYGSENSPKFVNGVLGTFMEERETLSSSKTSPDHGKEVR
ncbi:MAG: transcription antitermination factor NusB [Dehalococcoidia bacterium]